jgi:uncharacterized protein YfbU (UPF0304 family)
VEDEIRRAAQRDVNELKLTAVERLMLANQYEILAQLKKDDSYEDMAKNLRDGHKWIYDQYGQHLSEDLPDHKAQHVLAILGIFSDMSDSYDELTDKSGIDEHRVRFHGFDGNNESELLHFAAALSKNGNYSKTVGTHAKNSHMPTTDAYRRMIAEWERLGKPNYPYSKATIQSITTAYIHPDNR